MSIVEEGMQLLQGTTYVAEHCCMWMRRELSQHICLIIHSVNDSTAPPIAIYPIQMQLSGSRGRPKIIVNVELVKLLRGCGYTWNEIVNLRTVKDWDKRRTRNARLMVGAVKNVTGSHVLRILIVIPRQ